MEENISHCLKLSKPRKKLLRPSIHGKKGLVIPLVNKENNWSSTYLYTPACFWAGVSPNSVGSKQAGHFWALNN